MSGGFEVTETVATVTPGVNNGGMDEEPERETSFQGQEEKKKVKVPRGIRVPLRVEDEIWDGESIPKSRHSECEAEQLQVEDCSPPDGNYNSRQFSGDSENNNRAGENGINVGESCTGARDIVNGVGENAESEIPIADGKATVGERKEFHEPLESR